MEPLTETVDLDIDESNDLTFKIKLEGASSSPAKVRLVCEGNDFSYMFNGYGTGEDEVVQFTLPQMTNKISEGVYKARVEVLVENRYFAPLEFQLNFKKAVTVVAEGISVVTKASKPEIKVSAVPMVAAKPVAAVSTIKFEQRPVAKTPVVEQKSQVAVKAAPIQPGKPTLRETYLKKMSEASEETALDESVLRQIARTMLRDKARK
jgi:hypothetical protein